VVTAAHAAVRAGPDAGAPVLGRTGRDPTALVIANTDQGDWQAVRWNGRVGYVRADLTRSPVSYRIQLRVEPKAWKILWFVGGD